MPSSSSTSTFTPHGKLRQTLARRILAFCLEADSNDRWLIEQQLASRFNVSRTPIREALGELARLGLVEHHPNRGVKLLPFGQIEFRHIISIQALLEAEATRRATTRIADDELVSLMQRTELLLEADVIDEQWAQRVLQLDRDLHHTIGEACGNARLHQEIKRYSELIEMTHDLVMFGRPDPSLILKDHQAVLNAIKSQDAVTASKAIQDHILREYAISDQDDHDVVLIVNRPDVQKSHVAILMQPQPGGEWASKEIFTYRIGRYVMQILQAQGVEARMYWPRSEEYCDMTLPPYECPQLVQEIRSGNVRGIIAEHVHSHEAWLKAGHAANIPMVGTGGRLTAQVKPDHRQAVRDGLDRLISVGADRIALLSWNQQHSIHQPDWITFFREELEERGRSFNPDWCITDQWPLRHSAGWAGFREIWSADKVKPNGILICDDFLYVEAANAMLEMNIRVPEQLQVVTTANAGVPLLCPFPTNVLILDTKAYAAKIVKLILRPQRPGETGKDVAEIAYRMLPGQHSLAIPSEFPLSLGICR